jgi:hypothetical protein
MLQRIGGIVGVLGGYEREACILLLDCIVHRREMDIIAPSWSHPQS